MIARSYISEVYENLTSVFSESMPPMEAMSGVYFYVVLYCAVFISSNSKAEFRQATFLVRTDCHDTGFKSGDISAYFSNLDVFECLLTCLDNPDCQSVAEVSQNKFCSHSNQTLSASCSPGETVVGSNILEKTAVSDQFSCDNSGVLDNGTCICQGGFVGPTCSREAEDCAELAQYPEYHGQEGYFSIRPTQAPSAFVVYCSLSNLYPSPRLYVQRHMSVSYLFDKTWAEYRDGFLLDENNMWIGNQYLYYLTSSYPDYQLVVELASEGWTTIVQRVYYGFRVQSESQNFAMTFDGSGVYTFPDAGDSLIFVNGSYFTTFDNDNDGFPNDDCASKRGCGFWFSDPGVKCGHCNPNGRLIQNGDTRTYVDDEIFWTYDQASWSPWYVQMYFEKPLTGK